MKQPKLNQGEKVFRRQKVFFDMKSVVIVDYGMGNLTSVYNAFKFLGARCSITSKPDDVKKAERIVFPGVGSFLDAMKGLRKRNLVEPIKEYIREGRIFLGICLGLQILFEKSEEGNAKGLGIFKGKVKRFREESGIKIPHIGWNNIKFKIQNSKSKIMEDIENNSFFYFDHSYYGEPEDKDIVAATTDYGISFGSMLHRDNIYAVQFHPERSQSLGLKLLKNFIGL